MVGRGSCPTQSPGHAACLPCLQKGPSPLPTRRVRAAASTNGQTSAELSCGLQAIPGSEHIFGLPTMPRGCGSFNNGSIGDAPRLRELQQWIHWRVSPLKRSLSQPPSPALPRVRSGRLSVESVRPSVVPSLRPPPRPVVRPSPSPPLSPLPPAPFSPPSPHVNPVRPSGPGNVSVRPPGPSVPMRHEARPEPSEQSLHGTEPKRKPPAEAPWSRQPNAFVQPYGAPAQP